MYDHIGLKVKHLGASIDFYVAALATFGYELCSRDESSAAFGPPGEPAFWLYSAAGSIAANAHIAFRASKRSIVDRFHARGLEAGGRDHGLPGVRVDYGANYYAAFLLDPDGNNVEAVCTASA
jgi:catechol 2,3-dioxygenase-like lactoylglutathione lyase family enzyme